MPVRDNLFQFMIEVEQDCSGESTRSIFGCPTVLAARYVVWSALRQCAGNPLKVRGLGIVTSEMRVYADYIYSVNCGDTGWILPYPDIRCRRVNLDGTGDEPVYLQPVAEYRRLLEKEKTEPIGVELVTFRDKTEKL